MINADIVTGNADYQGTLNSVLRDFELFHEGNPIFQKKFDGSDIGIASVTQDTIELPQHFFVTGEEVVYSFDAVSGPIGIASTDIPGIGVTDKLPSTLFIVKQDELLVKVAELVLPRTFSTQTNYIRYHWCWYWIWTFYYGKESESQNSDYY